MMRGDNAQNRSGSSRMATEAELEKAGLFTKLPHSIFVGFFNGRPVYFHGPAGMTLTAGARGGKLRDMIAYNLLSGTCMSNIVMLDPKLEGYAISANQTADKKFIAVWNPAGLNGALQDRIDPLPTLKIENPHLISDLSMLWENLIPPSQGNNTRYFEGNAQRLGEALSLALVEIRGQLTFPDLYDAVILLMGGGDDWLDLAYHMRHSRFPEVRAAEREIHAGRKDSSGGFKGIVGELALALSAFKSRELRASVSPPFTFCLTSLLDPDQRWQLYLGPPVQMLSKWAPAIKAILVSLTLLKSREPSTPRTIMFLDEVGQLTAGGNGSFPLIPQLYTYGAGGWGITPVAVLQSNRQLRAFGPEAESLIMSSAAAKMAFAVRDLDSAKDWSAYMGMQSLRYDDRLAQERARFARDEAFYSLLNGADPVLVGLQLAQKSYETTHQSVVQRPLAMPEEIINMSNDAAIFLHEDVSYPIMLQRRPYWTQRNLAGRFLPNPYHPPLDRVSVMTRWGMRTRKVVTEPVPARFAHYPQYRDGTWTRVVM
ncbi:MAG: type IV secretory system conjugative DNA transfer family protein [Pseudomonadota bacterium]